MKRIIILLLLCLLPLVSVVSAQTSDDTTYGVPPTGETVLDLSGQWRVETVTFLDDEMLLPDYNDSDWREVYAPASWQEQRIEASGAMPTVAVYRRTFEAVDEWQGQALGLSAWFVPAYSRVVLNGVELEPEGTSPWLYVEVTDLVRFDEPNVLAVTSQFDGVYEITLPNPPRIGPLSEWDMPTVSEVPVMIRVGDQDYTATLYTIDEDTARPAVLMIGTGSHGLAFTEPYIPLARELAYAGYAALPLSLENQSPETISDAIAGLKGLDQVKDNPVAIIAAVESADAALLQAAESDAPAALIVLSARERDLPPDIQIPVLLIATTQDSLGPTSVYADRIAEALAGPSQVLVLPGKQSGLTILEGHWNAMRRATIDWLGLYLKEKPD